MYTMYTIASNNISSTTYVRLYVVETVHPHLWK